MQVNSSTVLVILIIREEPRVSSRGRLLKPTPKLLQLPNATDAPAGEGTFGSKQKQPKKRRLNAIIAGEYTCLGYLSARMTDQTMQLYH